MDRKRSSGRERSATRSSKREPSSNLGNAERESKLEAALGHMREAIAIPKQLGRSATFEEFADLALAQLKAGDAAAVTTADDIVARADRSGENTVWPHYCFLAAARVYHWKGDAAKAARAMRRAEELVRAQLGAIANEPLRAAFEALASVRAVRQDSPGTVRCYDPPDCKEVKR